MKTNHTFGKHNGINRTPFHQVHLAMSGEIVNDLNAPICSVDIDGVPPAIGKGNAEMVMLCLNNHDDLLQALKDCSDLLQQLKSSGKITRQCESVLTTAKDAITKATL